MAAARRPRFFLVVACIALAVALTGFAGTYFAPLAAGRFSGPPIVHLHGALLFGWLVLLLAQTVLVQRRDLRMHRRLGWAGLALAAGLIVSTVAVGVYATQRDVAAGGGETAISSLVGVCTSAAIFLLLAGAGVWLRRDGAAHKRLMLLATLAILWPAWFRFRHYFPFVPRPDITFAVIASDSLIVACMARDWLAERRVHPVFLWAGSAVIAEHVAEVLLFDTPPWRALAHALYNALS